MNHNPLSLFDKKQRHPGEDNDARCAMDKENVLYHRNGKPVLDKDGHPVYVDRQLGERPLLNDGEEDGLGDIPPEEKREDADFAVVVPPEEKREDADFAVIVPPEEEKHEGAPDDPDPLRVLLEEAGRSEAADHSDAADCSDAAD